MNNKIFIKKVSNFTALILFTLTIICSCSNNRTTIKNYNITLYSPKYATGFSIFGAKDKESTIITSNNPWQGANSVTTNLLILRNGESAPEGFNGEILRNEAKRIICMSASYIAMLDELGNVEKVVGVSGINGITNKYIKQNKDVIKDLGYDGNVDYELLLSLNPDIVLLYGINGSNTMEPKLKELGIPFMYIGEYLEESPLGKAEWVVAISEILNIRELGVAKFSKIPIKYNNLKDSISKNIKQRPKVMLNSPYSDSWTMPPINSYTARLIKDAGGDYIFKKNSTNSSFPIDIEEAYKLALEADVWINPGTLKTMKDFKSLLPKFSDIRCVKEGKIYNNAPKTWLEDCNSFWESGILHPELVLQDLVKIFHPDLMNRDFVYYYKLSD